MATNDLNQIQISGYSQTCQICSTSVQCIWCFNLFFMSLVLNLKLYKPIQTYMPLYLFCKYLSIYKKDSYLMILNFELTCVSAGVRCSFVSCIHTSISILPVLQHNTIYMPCTLREDFKQLSFNCVHIPDWSISFSSCIKCSYSCTVISRASPRTQLVSQAFLTNIYTPGMHPHLINHAYVFISLKVNSGTSSLLLC